MGLAGWDGICSPGVSPTRLLETVGGTLAWLAGWADDFRRERNGLEDLRRTIERAAAAGVQEDLLDTMRAKLEELELEVKREHTISVRDERTGATLAVVRSVSTDTLAQIGETVRRETGDCEHSVHFRLGDKALDNSWTLAEAGIFDGDVVSAVRTPLCWRSASGDNLSAALGAAAAAAAAAVPMLAAAFSPCGGAVFTRADNGEGKLWCAREGVLLCELSGQVLSGVFSADGRRLLGASDDSTARLWCTETGRCVFTLYGHADAVNLAVFSPDGAWIATASGDATACLWTADHGQRVTAFIGHEQAVNCVAFSPSGHSVVTASSDSTARIWSVESGHCERVLDGQTQGLRHAAYSPSGDVITTVSNDGFVQIWSSTRANRLLRSLHVRSKPVHAAVLSPDSATILVASASETLDLYSLTSGERVLTLTGHMDWVRGAAFSRDGAFVASAAHDGAARIWRSTDGACLQTLSGHTDWVGDAAFSSDGSLLATASYDGTARVWDVDTGDCRHVLVGNTDWARAAACSLIGAAVDHACA